ncbi:MAG: ribonuclease J [Bacilli bacterium]|nr:ribonuclease J [Bacilli bacterium]
MENEAVNNKISYPIKVTSLGGLDESGKNCLVIEVDNDAYIIECGLKYPMKNIPGIDAIIPDFDYLRTIENKIRGIIITHGHDDQYGAIPYLVNIIDAPIYCSKTTECIIKNTYRNKVKFIDSAKFVQVIPSSTVTIGSHVFDFFQTTHSVAESFGFALKTSLGNIVYTGDFMTDYSASGNFFFNLPKVSRISEMEKTFLLITESEAANKQGIASPNHRITQVIKHVIENQSGKIFISLYSQNMFNIQEVFNLAMKYNKRIVIANSEQLSLFKSLFQIKSLSFNEKLLLPLQEANTVKSDSLIVLVTSTGEKLFSLCKDICYGSISPLKVLPEDMWINASPSVPGTEVSYTDASDTIFRTDCNVLVLSRKEISSMHAQSEDIKMMVSLFRPKYYLPIKGEYRLLLENAKIAIDLGISLNHFNTFVFDNGMTLSFDNNGNPSRKIETVKCGDVMVDGSSIGGVKEQAISERQLMADGGVILIGIGISSSERKIITNPDIQMRGFLYLKDSEPLIRKIITVIQEQLQSFFELNKFNNIEVEKKISDKIEKLIYKETLKEPVVMFKIVDVDNPPNS